MASHSHDSFASSQNVGNSLGTRPCVRQTALYRQRESGNAMKELLGMSHLAWNNDENSGWTCNNQRIHPAAPVDDAEVLRPHRSPRVSSVPARAGYPVAHNREGQRTRAQAVPFQPRWGSVPTSNNSGDCHDDDAWDFEAKSASQVSSATPAVGSRARADRELIDTAVEQSAGRGRGIGGRHCSKADDELEGRRHGPSMEMRAAGWSNASAGRGRGRGGRGTGAARRPPNPGASPHPTSTGRRVENTPQRPPSPSPSASSVSSTPGSAAHRAGSAPTPKISSTRFDGMRVAPVFNAGGSRFADAYAQGSLPCHIDHGTFKNRIAWEISIDEIRTRREALLSLCVEGLRETRHPHATVARLAFKDLVGMDDCEPLSDGCLRQVMSGIRLALLTDSSSLQRGSSPKVGTSANRDGGVFEHALEALRQVAHAEGSRITRHLHLVLPPLGKRMFSKAHREGIQCVLRDLSTYGGPDAAEIMRARGVSVGVR